MKRSGTIYKTMSGKVGIVWENQNPEMVNGVKKHCMYVVDEDYNVTGSLLLVDLTQCKVVGRVG